MLKQPELNDKTKLELESSKTDNCLPKKTVPDFITENKSFLKKIDSELNRINADAATDVGFITINSFDSPLISVRVAKVRIADKQKYALNFDGNKLIYFDLPKLVDAPQLNSKRSNFTRCTTFHRTIRARARELPIHPKFFLTYCDISVRRL